ncbi:hypothetical protein SAMN04488076_11922 [Trichococcus palustris]|nr:hypothetical protein SAMN04488076_11922 [Trichococcus palustris]
MADYVGQVQGCNGIKGKIGCGVRQNGIPQLFMVRWRVSSMRKSLPVLSICKHDFLP